MRQLEWMDKEKKVMIRDVKECIVHPQDLLNMKNDLEHEKTKLTERIEKIDTEIDNIESLVKRNPEKFKNLDGLRIANITKS